MNQKEEQVRDIFEFSNSRLDEIYRRIEKLHPYKTQTQMFSGRLLITTE